MKTLFALVAAVPLAAAALAADLPPLEFPQGVGVNIHFNRGHERDLDLIAAAGFRFIRMDFGWAGIERRKGEYDWAAYDELTTNLEQRGLRAVYIFDYSNPLYAETAVSINPLTGKEQRDIASPRTPESVAAFARWAAAAAKRYRGRHIVWEIWNEPNISFWKPKPNVKDYSSLVLATCKAVREADPNATIVGPASSEFPWAFLEELFRAGALEHLDAVSVHPYRSYSKGPETAAEEYLRLRALIERYAKASKKDMPILSGEWGYATHAKGVSLETQAAFIARQQIANVWQGVPISIWYDWKNDGLDPGYNEHNFGTVSNDLAPKPSYMAVKTLTRELKGFRIARRLDGPSNADYIFLLVNEQGAQKLVAWTTGDAHTAAIPVGLRAADVAIVDGQGRAVSPNVADGKLTLKLEAAPQYVTLRRESPMLKAAAAWSLDGHIPTAIEAGSGPGLRIPVRIANPFANPVKAQVSVQSELGSSTRSFDIAPGKMAKDTFVLQPRLRTPKEMACSVNVEIADGVMTSRSTEHRQFIVANPLKLTVAPIASGTRVIVASPSGAPFRGHAVVGQSEYAVELNEGQEESTITAARTESATILLKDRSGDAVTEPMLVSFQPISATSFKAVLEGDSKIAATAHLASGMVAIPGDKVVERAFQLEYSFEAGWRFVQVNPTEKTGNITGSPRALGMWVHGDNSGNALRMRIVDSAGQTFQPSGPSLNWTGWRWVEFNLADLSHAGHWGGANDGIARGPLRLDTLLIVDGTRKKTAGTIYFGSPNWVY